MEGKLSFRNIQKDCEIFPFHKGKYVYLFLFLSLSLSFCREKHRTDVPLFRLVPSDSSGITFSNDVEETEEWNFLNYLYAYAGGGVAAGDVNNDGLTDLFFTGNQGNSKLYLNEGNIHFKEITVTAGISKIDGWVTGVVMADVNGDGFLDIYICRSGSSNPELRENLLFVNNHDLSFTEKGRELGVNDNGYSIQSAFFDFDNDHDLDLFVVNHPEDFHLVNSLFYSSGEKNRKWGSDHLYENINGKFVDVSEKAGIIKDKAFGLNVSIGDVNRDGWQDLYVSNDFWEGDYLYINQKNGTFAEAARKYFSKVPTFSMGSDFGDINNDGLLDLFTGDMMPEDNFRQKTAYITFPFFLYEFLETRGYSAQYSRNMLQLQHSSGSFSEIGQLAGVSQTDWSWATLFADFDNDGWKDLFVANGLKRDINNLDYMRLKFDSDITFTGYFKPKKLALLDSMPASKISNYIYKNRGDITFSNETRNWGMDIPVNSNGAAFADLDNDGDLDLVVNNLDTVSFVFENRQNLNPEIHFLRINPVGEGNNKFGLGCKITIWFNGIQQFIEKGNPRGYLSSSENQIHFGTGKIKKVDSLKVEWLGGKSQIFYDLPSDQTMPVYESNAQFQDNSPHQNENAIFAANSLRVNPVFRHSENKYNDFLSERILPHQISKEGPGIAVADVNNDGLEDFFVGGASGSKNALYLQNKFGKFYLSEFQPQVGNKKQENMGLVFFDANNDTYPDLYIANGSNEFSPYDSALQDQLFFNDGTGKFSLTVDALPKMISAGSCVLAADFDKDGDEDLFIGGRVVPGRYPTSPKSYLLRNDNSRFVDITSTLAPELMYPGMITAGLWTDFDLDGWKDLVLTGECMPIRFYHNKKGHLAELLFSGVDTFSGWWNSISGADLDLDGDIDFVVGNIGKNTLYPVSPEKPAIIFASDFDNNGTIDPVLTYTISGALASFLGRDVFCSQMPYLNNRFLTYNSWAEADITTIFSKEKIDSALRFKMNFPMSSIIWNEGNGKFNIHELPIEAQIAPVFGTLIRDFNFDGIPDILLCGNYFSNYYDQGNFDAMKGLLLVGIGSGRFSPVTFSKNGFYMPGDGKGLSWIRSGQGYLIVGTNNNDEIQVFEPLGENFGFACPLKKEEYATIEWKNGKYSRVEFYSGEGYLSQSSQCIPFSGGMKKIRFYSSGDKVRVMVPLK